VFHHSRDEHVAVVVAHRVHVDFNRVLEETVEQYGPALETPPSRAREPWALVRSFITRVRDESS